MHCSGLRRCILALATQLAFISGVIDFDSEYCSSIEHIIDHHYFNLVLPELLCPTKDSQTIVMRCTLKEYMEEIETPGKHAHVWNPTNIYGEAQKRFLVSGHLVKCD